MVIDKVRPTVDGGQLPAKAAVEQPVEISATIFADGHPQLMASAGYRHQGATEWRQIILLETRRTRDRWVGYFTPTEIGPLEFEVSAQIDEYGSWLRDIQLRQEADDPDIEIEFAEAAAMARQRASDSKLHDQERNLLLQLAAELETKTEDPLARIAKAKAAAPIMRRTENPTKAITVGPFPLWVDRQLAAFSAWYEFFPRSVGAGNQSSGTLATAQTRLIEIAAMGFEIVYLPPIHPIGHQYRKGPNNQLIAETGDPGSPWAIGSTEGGHTALHTDLGTFEDFSRFMAEAERCSVEIALDYALQCSPDHPWIKEHPQWFLARSDGSIRYAENPPKKYQDIYPLNFECADWENLWRAARDILLFWINHGVKIFRVDNPHTKPVAFWQWLINEIRSQYPEVIFLSESFTRPAMMHQLSKVGFTQSYTYFTWRNTKRELSEYLTELAQSQEPDWYRPNFWVNTPDILHKFLVEGGEPAFRLRLVLAALAAPSWGMYSGYELFERQPLNPETTEYLNSEKYQYRSRNYTQPNSLVPLVTRVNRIRQQHWITISLMRNLYLHPVNNDQLLCFSRRTDKYEDVLLIAVNLDPKKTQSGTIKLDLDELGVVSGQPFEVYDELNGTSQVWTGAQHRLKLNPKQTPAYVLHIRPHG